MFCSGLSDLPELMNEDIRYCGFEPKSGLRRHSLKDGAKADVSLLKRFVMYDHDKGVEDWVTLFQEFRVPFLHELVRTESHEVFCESSSDNFDRPVILLNLCRHDPFVEEFHERCSAAGGM
jgi:hypothetical protein